jgi:hypothetical protein
MNLTYAVDRLFESGWTPAGDADGVMDLDRLPDGRRFPSVLAVQREFARAGLELSIKHNMVFNCYRSTWKPTGASIAEPLNETRHDNEAREADERHGTVIGACQREAAVYALAQLREAQLEKQLAAV